MQKLWAAQALYVAKDFDESFDVMAVDKPDVIESDFFEQSAGGHHPLHVFLRTVNGLESRWQFGQHFLAAAADEVIGLARPHTREVAREAADVVGDRHIIVVKNNQHVVVQVAGVVERLEGHAGGHCAIADYGNRVAVFSAPLLALGDHHAKGSAYGRTRVPYAEGVIGAFAARRKSGQPAGLAHCQHTLAAARENFYAGRLDDRRPTRACHWAYRKHSAGPR